MLIRRIRYWLERGKRQAELRAEMEAHIEERAATLLEQGLAPSDARARATRLFGNLVQKQEESREIWIARWWADFVQDLWHGARMFKAEPAFTAAAVLTLALGIGANTAIFSIVKTVLIEPLPYRQSDRMVQLIQNLPATSSVTGKASRVAGMDLKELFELQTRSQTLTQVGAYDTRREVTLSIHEPVRVMGTPISASLFPMLGAQPVLGRPFTASEEKPGSEQPIILSYPAWLKYFGADPAAVNRTIRLDGRSSFIAGIMPRGFEFPDDATEFWMPLDLSPPLPGQFKFATPVGRLKDGIAAETAAAEVTTIVGRLRQTYPPERVAAPASFEVLSIKDEMVRPVRSALLVLMGGVAFVLLIACSNVANLLLARGSARQGELAIRAALGAGRGRLIRQTLSESFLLGIAGGTSGLIVAVNGVRFLRQLRPGDIPRVDAAGIDITVLAFTLALALLTSLLVGLIPAIQLSRQSEADAVKKSSARHSSERQMMRSVIVIVETAMAVILVIGGGLLIRSFIKLSNVNPGFDPINVLAFQIALPQPVNPNFRSEELTQDFESRLRSLPGVRSVAFSNAVPLIARAGYTQPRIEGMPVPLQGVPEFREVTRDYFATMGLRILSGRSFLDIDGAGQPRVVVINQAMAHYFGGGNPIGKTITLARNAAEIIGVVNDIHEQGLDIEPRPQVYIDSRQTIFRFQGNADALNWAYFVVRSDHAPQSLIPSIRSILTQMIPESTLKLNAADMEEVVSNSIARPRLYAELLGTFGALSVVLAMIGVYGVTAYSVTRRTREIGIRIALGARPSEVLALALQQGVVAATIGILLGLAGAAGVTRYLQGMLFGLVPIDPPTFVAIPALFAATALLAAFLPARRATKIDPLAALHYE